jgi:hypothetical protein
MKILYEICYWLYVITLIGLLILFCILYFTEHQQCVDCNHEYQYLQVNPQTHSP